MIDLAGAWPDWAIWAERSLTPPGPPRRGRAAAPVPRLDAAAASRRGLSASLTNLGPDGHTCGSRAPGPQNRLGLLTKPQVITGPGRVIGWAAGPGRPGGLQGRDTRPELHKSVRGGF
jgi:hypothetical protein